jgi:cation transport regulator ChaB
MPYPSNADLPAGIRSRYSERCQTVFREAFNRASGSEASHFRIAHTAARNCMESTSKAVLSSAQRENLRADQFACPEKRLYPIHDAAHVRAALSRIADPNNDQCGKAKILAAAKRFGIEVGKALLPVKAQQMDDDELDAWFAGRVPRRLLAIPFGGPIPSLKSPIGVDLDGEWFSQRTDIFGGEQALIDSKERLLDWHHGRDELMRRVVIGKTMLDPDPDQDGWWVEAWLNAGSKHLEMVRRLVQRGAQLFGSSEATRKEVNPDTGEITEWPMYLETLTTRPSNTLSILRPAKALLDEINESGVEVHAGLISLLSDLDALSSDLSPTSSRGKATAMAGRVSTAELEAAIEELYETAKKRY